MSESVTHADLHQDIGELRADVRTLMRVQAEQTKALSELQKALAKVQGGWMALTTLAAVAGGTGAAITWIWKYVMLTPGL